MRTHYLVLVCLICAVAAFCQTPPAPAASPNKAAIDTVKTYCSSIDDYKKDATPKLFADASDTAKPMWRAVGTERELESLTEALFKHTTTARVWLKENKVVAVDTEFVAGAEDWLLSSEYCFRDDGSLATLHSEFRNDHDDYIAIRDETYDADGASLAENVQYLDLRSRRPKKATKQMTASEVRAPLYHKASELPFNRLLHSH